MKRQVCILLFLMIGFLCVRDSFANEKLIVLTFDDGPKPYVLYGFDLTTKKPSRFPGLLDVLDNYGVKATFFVTSWRIHDCYGAYSHEEGRKAIEDMNRRGHQIENHTCGHGPFARMVRRYGESWVLNDIDRASEIIKSVIGRRPYYVRPPEWSIWPSFKKKIEARGYHVMARISDGISIPPLFADVDSEDYRHYELDPGKRPRCFIEECVMDKIRRREREGLYGHILAFHELPLTTDALIRLIPELKKRGYTFVTLGSYMSIMRNGTTK